MEKTSIVAVILSVVALMIAVIGVALPGPQGEQGLEGEEGLPGEQGPQGEPGQGDGNILRIRFSVGLEVYSNGHPPGHGGWVMEVVMGLHYCYASDTLRDARFISPQSIDLDFNRTRCEDMRIEVRVYAYLHHDNAFIDIGDTKEGAGSQGVVCTPGGDGCYLMFYYDIGTELSGTADGRDDLFTEPEVGIPQGLITYTLSTRI